MSVAAHTGNSEKTLSLVGWFKSARPLIITIFVFILIQGILFVAHSVPTARTESDGIDYLLRSIGPVFQVDPYQGIGYPWAIRFFSLSGLSPFDSAKLVSLFAGTIFVISVYFLALQFGNVRFALIALIFAAFNFNTVITSAAVMSDMLAASMFILTVSLFVVPDRVRFPHFFLAGLCAGLAYLTRYVYVFLIIMPPLYIILQENKRKHIPAALTFYLGFLVVTSPWMIFLFNEKGSPFYNENHVNLILKYMKQLDFPDRRNAHAGFLEIVLAYPLTFVESMVKSLLELPQAVFTAISPIGIWGTLGSLLWIRELNCKKILFFVPNLIYAALMLLVFLEPRYVLALVPMVAIFVAASIMAIPERISCVDLAKPFTTFIAYIPLRRLILIVLILFMAGFTIWQTVFFYSEMAPEYVEAGRQLQAIAPKDAVLLGWRNHIAFWAGVPFKKMGVSNIEELVKSLGEEKVTYVAIDERYTIKYLPQFRLLMESNTYSNILQPVVTVNTPQRVIIYKYVGRTN